MTYRTKRKLILLYTVLTLAVMALSLNSWTWNAVTFGFVWPEVMALIAVIGGGEAELTALGVALSCISAAVLLLHVAAPLCGFFRIYAPFKALLCVKAMLSLAAFALLTGWDSGLLLLLHGGLFALAVIFLRQDEPKAAPDAEVSGDVPGDVRLHPAQAERRSGLTDAEQ